MHCSTSFIRTVSTTRYITSSTVLSLFASTNTGNISLGIPQILRSVDLSILWTLSGSSNYSRGLYIENSQLKRLPCPTSYKGKRQIRLSILRLENYFNIYCILPHAISYMSRRAILTQLHVTPRNIDSHTLRIHYCQLSPRNRHHHHVPRTHSRFGNLLVFANVSRVAPIDPAANHLLRE